MSNNKSTDVLSIGAWRNRMIAKNSACYSIATAEVNITDFSS